MIVACPFSLFLFELAISTRKLGKGEWKNIEEEEEEEEEEVAQKTKRRTKRIGRVAMSGKALFLLICCEHRVRICFNDKKKKRK